MTFPSITINYEKINLWIEIFFFLIITFDSWIWISILEVSHNADPCRSESTTLLCILLYMTNVIIGFMIIWTSAIYRYGLFFNRLQIRVGPFFKKIRGCPFKEQNCVRYKLKPVLINEGRIPAGTHTNQPCINIKSINN